LIHSYKLRETILLLFQNWCEKEYRHMHKGTDIPYKPLRIITINVNEILTILGAMKFSDYGSFVECTTKLK
jgi:hypothetical protein